MALSVGYADPLGLLAMELTDYNTAVQIIEAARDLQAEREQRIAQYTADQFARFLIPGLKKALVAAIARAFR